jgi:type I restriction enzyme S subunit
VVDTFSTEKHNELLRATADVAIPSEWTWASIGDVARLINGDRSKNYPSKAVRVATGIPFINAGHLRDGRIQYEEMNYIGDDRYQSLSSGKIFPGDVLYCIRGSLGKAALVREDERGAIASSLVILRPQERVLPKYLLYFLMSPLAFRMVGMFDNGTAQPNLAAKSVSTFRIPLAQPDEQDRIVAEIEKQFTRLDAVTETVQRLAGVVRGADAVTGKIAKLRFAILRSAFEGRLLSASDQSRSK